ncbi:MAG TPA: methyltransferase domain-containing protein [Pseudonocardia sp.]|nr:methyltransferase domain-containing protein [Pseudonocardia sp.]
MPAGATRAGRLVAAGVEPVGDRRPVEGRQLVEVREVLGVHTGADPASIPNSSGAAARPRPPSTHLTEAAADLRPGVALDAGCGHGSDTLWLAARGRRVTAVDFSATSSPASTSTWRGRWRRGWHGWRWGSRPAGPCSWSVTDPSTRPPEPRLPPPVRCRSPSTGPSPRSTPPAGSSPSPRTARARRLS